MQSEQERLLEVERKLRMEIFELQKKNSDQANQVQGNGSQIELLHEKVNDTQKVMEKEVGKRQHFEGKITCLQSLQRDTLEKYNRCLQDMYILEKTNKENESLI